MSNSKKITQLTEAKQSTDYENSYFVVANTDNNKKLSYNTLKSSILKGTGIDTFNPEDLSEFNNMSQVTENKVLTAKGGKIIATALQTRIPINSSSLINITTPLLFPNESSLKTNQTPKQNNDVVNLGYLNSRITPSLFNEFKTKDYIYGDEILATIGKPLKFNKTNPDNWIVTEVLPVGERNNTTGWQKMNTTLSLKSGKKISDYKKIIVLIADEDGNSNADDDTQIFAYSFDCGEYIHFFEKYKQRLNVYNKINSASNSNPIKVKVCNQNITWKNKNLRTKNHGDYVYISPNYYVVNNESNEAKYVYFKYTKDYDTTITSQYTGFLVAVIGLK